MNLTDATQREDLQELCSVTGLPVRRRPGWTDVKLGRLYSASFCLIGSRVLLSVPKGNAGNWGVPRFMEARERVLRQAGIWDRPHVEIKDYGQVAADHPRFGRVQFTLAMAAEQRRGQLKGFWAFNGPTSFSNILNVAKRLVRHRGIPVNFVSDYEEALLHALAELSDQGHRETRSWRDELFTRDGWRLDLARLSARSGIIGRDILYAEVRGRMRLRHVDRVHQLGQQALAESGRFPQGQAYRVFNLDGLEGISWRARRAWLGKVRDQQSKNPCPLLVMAGLNRTMGAAARVSGPVLASPVETAHDMEEALDKVQSHREQVAVEGRPPSGDAWRVPKIYTEDQVRRHADDLLRYVGAINWELPGQERAEVERDHPLRELYEAVAVIKHDFDTMVQERAAMQAQVFRAAKIASLGTLAAGFAHELNNPLTAVLGFAQRIQEVSTEPAIQKFAQVIERASRRMSGVVGQLGEYSREPNMIREVEVDLNSAAQAVLELLGPVFTRQRVELDVQLTPDLPPVMGDSGHMRSLVQNLVINARDALMESPPSQGERVSVRTWRDDIWVKLSVADNGPGMPEEVIQQAFDPFFTTKEVGKGTGLGLYVVHRIVDQYNGTISIRSNPGQGTRIEVQFPAVSPEDG